MKPGIENGKKGAWICGARMAPKPRVCPIMSNGQFVPHDQYNLGGAFTACTINCLNSRCMAWDERGFCKIIEPRKNHDDFGEFVGV